MKMKAGLILLLIATITTILGCFTRQKLSRNNLAFLYLESDTQINPSYILHHNSNDTSTIYLSINTDNLLYAREHFLGNFFASFSISYELLDSYDSKKILDSAAVFFSDTVKKHKLEFVYDSIKIPIPKGQNYLLKLTAKDINRKSEHTSFIEVKKMNNTSAQHFLLFNNTGNIEFKNYFNKHEELRVHYNNATTDKLFIKYYKNNFSIATPPFHTTSGKPVIIYPDSIYELDLQPNSFSEVLQLRKEGVYRIEADTVSNEGLTIFRFHEDYPNITLPKQMIYSARYLTTRQEFDRMMLNADKKEAVDMFWLNLAGNKDRARQLIKTYYNRVRATNTFFTSYHEGWKTDRGMIFIIYGQPTTVYKREGQENWIYGDPSNIRSINFSFFKSNNPLTDNDFVMSKSEIYKDSWYYAVSNWRR